MKIQVLGGHGGLARGFSTTSFLIDDILLLDAGAVAGALSIEDQCRIEHILISHCHLDHTKDLAFLCDNCFGLRPSPFQVHTHHTVKQIILDHLLNDVVWPDFSKLPSPDKPTIQIHGVEPEHTFRVSGFEVTPVPVKHPLDAMGYIIEKDNVAVLFTCDTASTERIWEVASKFKNLKAIFTEVSFPNKLQKVADLSDHHTAATLMKELPKMPKDIPIILTHLKPNYREEIMAELKLLNLPRVKVLEKDGQFFNF
ncbi:MAG: 3',5'-cyclic-nucleotide phosphodiesterase [Bdellovibrionota bacterium]